MRKTKEILRQKWALMRPHRDIAKSVGVSVGAVWTAIMRAKLASLASCGDVEPLDEATLEGMLYGPSVREELRPEPDCQWIHRERPRMGVTLELLHEEYRQRHPDGYGYTTFCDRYREWLGRRGLVMRQVHVAGDAMFVEYSGKKRSIVDRSPARSSRSSSSSRCSVRRTTRTSRPLEHSAGRTGSLATSALSRSSAACRFYWVPYALVHEEVWIRATATSIAVLLKGRRVASHLRSFQRGRHTTVAEHMPRSHRDHAEWTPSRILGWAELTGPETRALCDAILRDRPHPEQGFRSCLGILRLGKREGAERLEPACARANRPPRSAMAVAHLRGRDRHRDAHHAASSAVRRSRCAATVGRRGRARPPNRSRAKYFTTRPAAAC